MSASERAVIYVDSGSGHSSITSMSSMSSSTSISPPSSSRRGGTRINTTNNAIVPHQEIMKSSTSNSSNNFVIKIQIGEESTLFNPVRIDVATKNGHLHRIQHHHVSSTATTNSGPGKSILIAATSTSSNPDDDLSPTNSSNSGQSSPRSDMTPPPLGKGVTKRLHGNNLLPLRFGSETSESDTESDISSLTDYQIGKPSQNAHYNKVTGNNVSTANHVHKSHGNGDVKLNQLQPVPSSSCPAAQYVMREILGMSLADAKLDNSKKSKLIEEQTKFVQLKQDVHKSLMKTFSAQETKLKPIGMMGKSHVNNRKETFSDEIKKVVQLRLNKSNTNECILSSGREEADLADGSRVEIKEIDSNEKEHVGYDTAESDSANWDDSMADVMRMVTANNKIVSFTPASPSDSSSPIILDQNYFHLNEIKEFGGGKRGGAEMKDCKEGDGRVRVGQVKEQEKFKSSNRDEYVETLSRNFAGYKDIFARTAKDCQNQIMSDNGTIRGVKNRVRDGIATFLQTKDIKNYNEKEKGRLVVYVTSMGVVRDTFQRCQKVKQILRTLLVKFDERDCYMNRSVQDEIRERLQYQNNNNLVLAAATSSTFPSSSSFTQQGSEYKTKSKTETSGGIRLLSSQFPSPSPHQKHLLNKSTLSNNNNGPAGPTSFCTNSSIITSNVNHSNNHNLHNKNNLPINFISLPQVFLEGQHLGDADAIEKLNETGQLRDILKPFKSLSVLSTCDCCGGFRMLPCPVCNGSKKSVHRNHFTTEFVALKCMHCDQAGLVRCDTCNAPDEYKRCP